MEKGYTGTRMQEVADVAGINKAMLHYYFRSKEKLFRVILTQATRVITPMILKALSTDKGVMGKLEDFVSGHVAILLERPHLPMFIMHELSQNQGAFMTEILDREQIHPMVMGFFQQVIEEGQAGKIRVVNPIHLLMNTISMTVFPFIMRPMVVKVGGIPEEMFQSILKDRKEEIIEFVQASLKP
jgi:TetR/AcrR family transcriptional regulator